MLARNTSLWIDNVWVIDSTAVECARSRDAARRSEWAEYGYCASHSRYFWGLRLHMLATLHGLPIGLRADQRQGRRRRRLAGHPAHRPDPEC